MHFDIKKSIHIFILSMITPSNGNIIKDTGFSLSMASTGANGQVNKLILSEGWRFQEGCQIQALIFIIFLTFMLYSNLIVTLAQEFHSKLKKCTTLKLMIAITKIKCHQQLMEKE